MNDDWWVQFIAKRIVRGLNLGKQGQRDYIMMIK